MDGERLARERARELLREDSGVEVVGECAGPEEAIGAIRASTPDLVLLDVQMPGKGGLAVLAEIGAGAMAAVVFMTAPDRRALRAFDEHAFDYVLKPFDAERFRSTLKRVRAQLPYPAPGAFRRRLLSLLEDLKPRARPQDRLVIRSGGRVSFLKAEEIDWIEAEGNYVRIHAGSQRPLVRDTMSEIEARLDSSRFVRIHKSTIVNADRIKEIQPLFNGTHSVLLHDGTRLTWSRGYREQLRALTGEED
ncbi:MAG TPA: LytTR family DNA-binding domain-containing protein [Thermoanaerobaculia bacterium]|nr:LytTR family DNA-binding domain-containing protein [Thermoanaerobaculia bacterium]